MADSKHDPADPPPPYQANPATQYIREIADLKAQVARLQAMLKRVAQTDNDTAAAGEDGGQHVRINTTSRFGRESMAHITREHIIDILNESLCSAPAKEALAAANATTRYSPSSESTTRAKRMALWSAAVPTILVEMVKLIYSVPENQPWYTLDGGVRISQKADDWILKTSRGEVVRIGVMVFKQMDAKLSHKDKNSNNDCFMTLMQFMVGCQPDYPCYYTHATFLVYV